MGVSLKCRQPLGQEIHHPPFVFKRREPHLLCHRYCLNTRELVTMIATHRRVALVCLLLREKAADCCESCGRFKKFVCRPAVNTCNSSRNSCWHKLAQSGAIC